jgi:hypothetical protein
MLVYHSDAQGNGFKRVMNPDRGVVDPDFARIRLVKAVQDIHQGCFSGSVFTQESQDFTGFNRETDILIGWNAVK